jgi:hypothetical protein
VEIRYLTNEDGERVGVILDTEEYGAIMEVYGEVARASRALQEAEESSSEARLVFEARMAEAHKALEEAARKLEAVYRDFPPRGAQGGS